MFRRGRERARVQPSARRSPRRCSHVFRAPRARDGRGGTARVRARDGSPAPFTTTSECCRVLYAASSTPAPSGRRSPSNRRSIERPPSRAAASSTSSCARVGRGSRAPRSVLRKRPSSVRILSSDSRPSSSIRENRERASSGSSSCVDDSCTISCNRARTARSRSDARRSRSISTASAAVTSRCRRSCADRRASSAAARSRVTTIRPAPQTASDSGTTNAAIEAAPGTPWMTDSVAPTNASPARSATSPATARPRGALVDKGKRIATATGIAITSRN